MNKTMKRIKPKKILVNLWQPLLDKLTEKCKEACLSRDSFLCKLVKSEIAELERELIERIPEEMRMFSVNQLRSLALKPVALAFAPDVVELLDNVCERKNVARDCFINRLLFCLVMPHSVLDALFCDDDQIREKIVSDHKWDAPGMRAGWGAIDTIIEVQDDPFWYIRLWLEIKKENTGDNALGFYTTQIPPTLFKDISKKDIRLDGLNLFHPDPAIANELDDLDTLLSNIEKEKGKKRLPQVTIRSSQRGKRRST